MAERRSWAVLKFGALAMVGTAILLVGSQVLFGWNQAADVGTARVLIPTAAAAMAMAWSVTMGTLAFRRLDEFQQAAGRFAWYWGGSLGVAMSAVGYVFIAQGGLHWLDPQHFHLGRDLFRAFQIGYVLAIGCLASGFLVARIVWQVTKR